MTYKKTWLSYILWAFYTCAAGVILADYAILFWQKKMNAVIGYGTIVFVFLVFAGVTGCYFLIRKALSIYHEQDNHTKEKSQISSRTALLWEVFIVLSIFFSAFLYRLYLYLQGPPGAVAVTEYYHAAALKAGEGVKPMVHGASYLYTMCLSFVLSFLGNKAAAAVWLQIAIQMLTIFVSFFTVRKIIGRIPACVTIFVLAFSSVYTGQIFMLTPEDLFFLLYLTGFFIIGSYVRMYCREQSGMAAVIAGALLSGITIGVLCYLDAVSLTLLFFLPALFTGIRGQKKSMFSSAKISVAIFVLILASGGLSFMGMLAIDAFCSGGKIGQIAEAWYRLYRTHIAADYVFYQTKASVTECFVLAVFAALYIMAFWNRRKEQNAAPWICLMFVLAPTPLTAVGVLSAQVYAVFIWSVLAGIGMQQSFVWEKKQMTKMMAAELQPISGEEQTPEQTRESLTAISGTESEPASESVPAPRFIENPLPLPKKHEKRIMDYQYEVAADETEFDVEVKEDDDFDIS